MDEQTRRDVDEACLRLLGWTDLEWWDKGAAPNIPGIHWAETGWYGRRAGGAGPAPSPSADSALVVPLAEALRGYYVSICSSLVEPGQWEVSHVPKTLVYKREGDLIPAVFGATIQEALATAAARAVGTENDK